MLGPHVGALAGLLSVLNDAAVGPEEEGTVEDSGRCADDSAGDGGGPPFIGSRSEEIVGNCKEAKGGRGKSGPVVVGKQGLMQEAIEGLTERWIRPGTARCGRRSRAAL